MTSSHLSTQFHQVLFGGNWTWVNLKDTLADISYHEAVLQRKGFNSILALSYHIGYYFGVQLKVLQSGALEGKDEDSWIHPPVHSQEEWEALVQHILETGDRLSKVIQEIPEKRWSTHFTDEKYGSYARNIMGMIEHTHYHLGQIVILKKSLRVEKDNSINYIEMPAADLEVIKTFYQDVFGWKFQDYGPGYTSFSGSGVDGGFYKSDEAVGKGSLVVIYHESLEVVNSKVEDAGGRVTKDIFSFPGGARFEFCDPAGNHLAVWRTLAN